MKRRESRSICKSVFRSVILTGLALLASTNAHSQALTLEITSVDGSATNNTVTRFTPLGFVPPTLLVPVEVAITSNTTGDPVSQVIVGLDGTLDAGNSNWNGPATGIASLQVGLWNGDIDLAFATNITGNAVSPFTLRAFAYTGMYYTPDLDQRALVLGYDAVSAEKNMFIDIRDSTALDADGNGIPDADRISSVTPGSSFETSPANLLVTPDPDDPDNPFHPDYLSSYLVERLTQSIDEGNIPTFITVTKQMISNSQLYDITISLPNLSFFKANFFGVPEVTNATNAVVVIRGEQDPLFLVDNFAGQPSVDPNLSPMVDLLADFVATQPDAQAMPTSFIHLSVLLEQPPIGMNPPQWIELDLEQTASLSITVRSVALNAAIDGDDADSLPDVDVYRYGAITRQSTAFPNDIHVLGDDTVLPATNIIGITRALTAVVTTDAPHGLAIGESVRISGVTGMAEVNDRDFAVSPTGFSPTSFGLVGENSSFYSPYLSGGTAEQRIWQRLADTTVTGPTPDGGASRIQINELVRGSIYAIAFPVAAPPASGGGGGGGGGCLIATAAYGTPMAEEIGVLREFRDAHLLNSYFGTAFVDTYYRLSPGMADAIANQPILGSMVRVALIPVILLVKLFEASKMFMVMMFLFLGFLMLWNRKMGRSRQ